MVIVGVGDTLLITERIDMPVSFPINLIQSLLTYLFMDVVTAMYEYGRESDFS